MLKLLFDLCDDFESLSWCRLHYRILLSIVIDFSLKLLLFLALNITNSKGGR